MFLELKILKVFGGWTYCIVDIHKLDYFKIV